MAIGFIIIMSINVSICVFVAYLIFYTDVSDAGLNGLISRFLFVDCVNTISNGIKYCCGDDIHDKVFGLYDYIVNKPNPILMIFYLILLNGIFITWLTYGHPNIPASLSNVYLNYHYTPLIGVICCHYSLYKAVTSTPGFIDASNLKCFMHSKYDDILFIQNNVCQTCNIVKVIIILLWFLSNYLLLYT